MCNDRLSDAGAFGVKSGRRVLNEFGANIRAEAKTTLWKKLSLYSRLELYSNYLHNPQNIDINWDIQSSLRPDRMAHRQPLCQYDIRR